MTDDVSDIARDLHGSSSLEVVVATAAAAVSGLGLGETTWGESKNRLSRVSSTGRAIQVSLTQVPETRRGSYP